MGDDGDATQVTNNFPTRLCAFVSILAKG